MPWVLSLGVWWALAAIADQAWLDGLWLVGCLGIAWMLWVWLWRRAGDPGFREWILWGCLMRVPGLLCDPVLEDDPFRFLWDGRQFARTGNPYATAPLEHFRDDEVDEAFQEVLDRINHPEVPTIYGPVCQFGFLVSYGVAPGRLWPWKLLLFLAEGATAIGLARLGGQARGCAFWVCPLVVFETSFNAHPDALGVALLVGGILAGQNRRGATAGVLLGLAVAARVFAVVALPFVLLRAGWRGWLGAVAAWAACYLPFWMQGSLADWRGLGAFAGQWEFNSSVFAVLQALLGSASARLVSAGLFGGGLVGLVVWHGRRGWPAPRGEWIFGALFLCSATVNPWYLLWLVPFVALRPTWTGITALGAVALSYLYFANLGRLELGYAHPGWVRPLEYGLVLAVAMAETMRRRRREEGIVAAAVPGRSDRG